MNTPHKPWPFALRLLFRFLFCYYVLYMAPAHGTANLLSSVPGTSWLTKPYMNLWDGIETWVAVHVFHLAGEVTTRFLTGSGDTTLDYVETLCNVVVSLAGMAIWSVLGRRQLEYTRLHSWLRLLLRYTLGVTMLSYGFAKVFPLQFGTPGFARLLEPYGEFSPMGSLWWFMGASLPYIIFSGCAEVTGGLLLFFRRTTLLGSMICIAVVANVVALNFCYDTPVKLYSTNLLLIAVFLMAPDLPRLFRLLILNRPVEPADYSAPRFANRKLRIAAIAVQVLFVGQILYGELHGGWEAYQARYVHPQRPPLYGAYDVESFIRNGQEVGLDPARPRKVAVDNATVMTVRTMDDTVLRYNTKYDASGSGLTVTVGKSAPGNMNYTRPDADHVLLTGKLGADTVSIKLKKIDPKKFLLLTRGFHWINERPLNR
ncbi:MAG TPA: hypothetical protein VG456_26680 [Candidatus Sulfopaludibacter sp.]|jgi:uncharacterized membrane protein YphA (DoxX/SURF4 family)|nr:hypothetical protein [Candidatus Sulfopaludibacter sp.]